MMYATYGSFMVGLDLGQAADYSALAVVERVQVLPAGLSLGHWERHEDDHQYLELVEEVRVRHLQRWELGTPYPAIVADVASLMTSPQLRGAWLTFDRSGVGRGVGDLLKQAYMAGRMGDNWPTGTTITGGAQSSAGNVPKRDLLTNVQILLQQGRLKIAAGLALGETLERELTSFRQKLSAAGRDSYDVARREGEGHGDLVIAVALAARKANPSVLPRLEETEEAG